MCWLALWIKGYTALHSSKMKDELQISSMSLVLYLTVNAASGAINNSTSATDDGVVMYS